MRQSRTAYPYLHLREKTNFYLLEMIVILGFPLLTAESNPNQLENHTRLESNRETSRLWLGALPAIGFCQILQILRSLRCVQQPPVTPRGLPSPESWWVGPLVARDVGQVGNAALWPSGQPVLGREAGMLQRSHFGGFLEHYKKRMIIKLEQISLRLSKAAFVFLSD